MDQFTANRDSMVSDHRGSINLADSMVEDHNFFNGVSPANYSAPESVERAFSHNENDTSNQFSIQ